MPQIKDPAKLVYTMLACQYKPLEKKMLIDCQQHNPDFAKKYHAASYAVKIRILDKYAALLKL